MSSHRYTGLVGPPSEWQWTCSCGSVGRPNGQSPNAAAFKWYGHFFKALGVVIPRDHRYRPWMRQSTEKAFGLRAADVQRAYLDLREVPAEGQYPWASEVNP